MTVRKLREYLAEFPDDAIVTIWEWDNPKQGDNEFHCDAGRNVGHQLKENKVTLFRDFQAGSL